MLKTVVKLITIDGIDVFDPEQEYKKRISKSITLSLISLIIMIFAYFFAQNEAINHAGNLEAISNTLRQIFLISFYSLSAIFFISAVFHLCKAVNIKNCD